MRDITYGPAIPVDNPKISNKIYFTLSNNGNYIFTRLVYIFLIK